MPSYPWQLDNQVSYLFIFVLTTLHEPHLNQFYTTSLGRDLFKLWTPINGKWLLNTQTPIASVMYRHFGVRTALIITRWWFKTPRHPSFSGGQTGLIMNATRRHAHTCYQDIQTDFLNEPHIDTSDDKFTFVLMCVPRPSSQFQCSVNSGDPMLNNITLNTRYLFSSLSLSLNDGLLFKHWPNYFRFHRHTRFTLFSPYKHTHMWLDEIITIFEVFVNQLSYIY